MAYLDADGITTLTQAYDSRYIKDVNHDGIVPVSKGGTGANTAAGALSNLGAAAANHTHPSYENQNAFSNVVVGSTTLTADTTTDTLTITAGSNVTLTPTASSDSFSIAASDTLKSAASGASDGSYLVSVVSGAATLSAYTAPTVPVTSVNGETGAVVLTGEDIKVVSGSGAETIAYAIDAIGNAVEYKMPKSGGTFTGAPKYASDPADNNTLTRKSYVDSAIASALTASMSYKGTIGTGGTVTALPASATVGDVYMVKTAGTWAGKTCEAGDMLICNTTYTTVSNDYWDVVQANLTTLTDAEIIAAVAAA